MNCTYARATNGVITWTLADHGLSVGDIFAMTSCVPDGDGDKATLGLYTVATVPTSSTFTATDLGYVSGSVAVVSSMPCTIEVEPYFSGTYSLFGGLITVTTSVPNIASAGRAFRVNFTSGTAVDGIYTVTSTANDTTFYASSSQSTAATSGNCKVTFQPRALVNMVFTGSTDPTTMDVRYNAAVLPMIFDTDTTDGAQLQSFVRAGRMDLRFESDTANDIEMSVRTTVAFLDLQFTSVGEGRLGVTTLTALPLNYSATTPDTTLGTAGPASPVPMVIVPEGPAEANMTLAFAAGIIRGAITVTDIIEDAVKLWGRASAREASKADAERLIADLNATLEEMYSRAAYLDYFNRKTLDITFATGVNVATLPVTVQNLHGYIKAPSGKIISPIARRTDFEAYAATYLTPEDNLTEPYGYFLDRQQDNAAGGFVAKLYVTPAPVEDITLKAEVNLNPVLYSWTDYINNTPVPVAHKHASSVLLPLMRKRTSSARKFVATEQQKEIDQQYAQARAILGYVDPAPASVKRQMDLEPAPVAL